MALVEVPCPGCGAVLRAPDTMAGKKGRCKKCNTPFRIPGAEPQGESVGESHMLSAVDAPSPLAAAPPKAADNPFDFDAASPPPPPPAPEPPKPKSVPKAEVLPPKPQPAPKKPAAAPPAAAGGFDFGAMLDEPPAPKAEELPADEDVPAAAPASDDPFGFPAGAAAAEAAPASSTRNKPKGKDTKAAKDPKAVKTAATGRGYRQKAGGGGKRKFVLVGLVALVVATAVAGVLVYVNKHKGDQAQAGKGDDKDKKGEPPPPTEPPKTGPTPPDPKDAAKGAAGKKEPVKKEPGKKEPGKGTGPSTAGGVADRPLLLLPPSVKGITLQAPNPKPEVFVERNGDVIPIDAEFPKVRRLMAPGHVAGDIGVLWEREGVPNTPGNKLVMDVCRPTGTRQQQIEFTGDGKPVPAADLSDDGRYFAHGDGSRVTVWKVEDKSKPVDAWDVYAALPAQQKAGLAAVYFPPAPKEAKDAPPNRLITVATDGAVHLWDLAGKKQLGGFVPPRGKPGRVVEGRGVALSQTRHFVVVAVAGVITKCTFDGDTVDHVTIADLGGDVQASLGLATYGETTVYAFEAGEKREKVVMLLGRGDKHQPLKWPEALGPPVGVGWVSGDLVAVSSGRGGAVMFEFNDERGSLVPKYAVVPPNDLALHATTDVCHWYLIPNPADAKRCVLVQLSPPSGGGLLDEPAKGGGIPLGRLDPRGLMK